MKKIIVFVKQVPDTANIAGDSMKEDGTVNRAALPAIFNPEDLNALEMALEIKDVLNAEVTVITMGPPKAVEILKHSLYLGADRVFLISDRKFAGSDTLATSYVLSEAVRSIGQFDVYLAGRQAIDGDTAQVGPQIAEKLGLNIISYVSKLTDVSEDRIVVEKDSDVQTEVIRAGFPLLMTVTPDANSPRYPNSAGMLRYFRARLGSDISENDKEMYERNDWIIPVLGFSDLDLDPDKCGLNGSPTKVHKIKNIVLKGGDLKIFDKNEGGVMGLVKEIIKDYSGEN
ncbi:MAG: electron transfer flavoprotein subunit beta/FixA family protein [Acidobacteriota bacterium]